MYHKQLTALNIYSSIFVWADRESNPGPLAPKARIIPLDQPAVRRPGIEPGAIRWKRTMLPLH